MAQTYNGQLGLVLLPDAATRQVSITLAGEVSNNRIELGQKHEPHLTLYHSKLADVPEATVRNLVAEIAGFLPLKADFTRLAPFGGKFLFWNTKRDGALSKLHSVALALSRFYVSFGEQQAERESLDLSPEQAENMRKYGHPLVGDLWRPHITVGYCAGDAPLAEQTRPYQGVFDQVAFVDVGEYGTIKRMIINSQP